MLLRNALERNVLQQPLSISHARQPEKGGLILQMTYKIHSLELELICILIENLGVGKEKNKNSLQGEEVLLLDEILILLWFCFLHIWFCIFSGFLSITMRARRLLACLLVFKWKFWFSGFHKYWILVSHTEHRAFPNMGPGRFLEPPSPTSSSASETRHMLLKNCAKHTPGPLVCIRNVAHPTCHMVPEPNGYKRNEWRRFRYAKVVADCRTSYVLSAPRMCWVSLQVCKMGGYCYVCSLC